MDSLPENIEKDIKLTPKEECFCREYVMWLNGTKAAINARYSPKTAGVIACELLKKPNVKAKIEHLKSNLAETSGISALRIVREHEKIAFMDSGQIREGWITLREFQKLTPEQRASIQEVSTKTIKKNVDGIGEIEEEYVKIKLYDKQKSLDSLSKMLGYESPIKMDVNQNINSEIEVTLSL